MRTVMTTSVLHPETSSAGGISTLLRPALGFVLSNAALLALMLIMTAV